MATRPIIRNLNATSVGIINWVLAEESGYLAGAPLAKDTIESIQAVGQFINAFQSRQNQFLGALVNRIGMVVIASKTYKNPWAFTKRGMLDAGETIEEIYVNLAKVEQFKQGNTTNELLADLFGKRKPDVQVAFHSMNFQKKYPVTVSAEQLPPAFTSMEGVNNLIDYIVQSLYTAVEYDDFLMCKYVLYRLALDGKIKATKIDALSSEANAKAAVKKVKAVSNEMTFLKTGYNMAGVYTHTPKEDQMVVLDTEVDATIDIDVLSSAFNMDKAQFSGVRILVDGFGTDEVNRLDEILDVDTTGGNHCFTSDELTAIGTIKMIIMDREFLMEYDKLFQIREMPVANTLEWQYFLHRWCVYSASPFKNVALFTTADSAVSSVTVTPSTADAAVGTSLAFTATVATTGFINADVVWSVVGAAKAGTKIGRDGILVIDPAETGSTGTLTVKATSVADSTKYGTATVTLVASN